MIPHPNAPDPVLYIVACGAPPARDVATLVTLAQTTGWDTCVIATPMGRRFLDPAALEDLTGHPLRSDYKLPGSPDVLPDPDALIVAPATCNTINKWAAGISDTLALGLLVEAIGLHLPLIAMPYTNRAQAAHPAFERSLDNLRSWGVTILYGPDIYPLHPPRSGHPETYPWHKTLEPLGEPARHNR